MNRKRSYSILDPYFREIRGIHHFRPLKKNFAFAYVLQLLTLLALQVSANINCYETGMRDLTDLTRPM